MIYVGMSVFVRAHVCVCVCVCVVRICFAGFSYSILTFNIRRQCGAHFVLQAPEEVHARTHTDTRT